MEIEIQDSEFRDYIAMLLARHGEGHEVNLAGLELGMVRLSRNPNRDIDTFSLEIVPSACTVNLAYSDKAA